jgi:predicted amidohydrolase
MRVGFYQYCPVSSVIENVGRLLARLNEVTDALIVLPELFLMDGSDPVPIDNSDIGDSLASLLSLSEKKNLSLVGSLAVNEGSNTYNRLFYLHSGSILGTYDKRRLFRGEKAVFCSGSEEIGVFVYNGCRFASQVCFDLLDPVPVANALRTSAIDLLVVSSAASVDYMLTLAKARSLENQIVTVWANRWGKDRNGTVYLGRSCIYCPDGSFVEAEAGEDVKIIDISEEDLKGYSKQRKELMIV